jgi:hypothetical protein
MSQTPRVAPLTKGRKSDADGADVTRIVEVETQHGASGRDFLACLLECSHELAFPSKLLPENGEIRVTSARSASGFQAVVCWFCGNSATLNTPGKLAERLRVPR